MIWKRIVLMLLLLAPELASARTLETIYKNNSAVRGFRKEKALESYEEFVKLLAAEPHDPLLQFNIGSSLSVIGEEEKAEALYKQLLKQIDERLTQKPEASQMKSLLRVKFATLYNLGVHAQARGDNDEALTWYQKGLEIVPGSLEIKTNIEMMFASGKGGKGKSKDKKEGDPGEEGQDGEQPPDENQPRQNQPDKQQGDKKDKKQFDEKYMSGQDLKRIMEELKQQEQGIRAKYERKGGKGEDKDKNW